jgi:hypothetical protein
MRPGRRHLRPSHPSELPIREASIPLTASARTPLAPESHASLPASADGGRGLVGAIRRVGWSSVVPVAFFILALVGYWLSYTVYRTDTPIHSDGEGYYAYLTSYLLHLDPTFKSVLVEHWLTYYPKGFVCATTFHYAGSGCRTTAFGLVLWPNGNYEMKYPIGEAVLLLPFFGLGHGLALAAGAVADGYSRIEAFTAGSAAMVYATLGLVFLRSLLRRWFSDSVVAVTLIVCAFGTSVFDYATFDSMFSHDFSFFAVAATLLCAMRWYERPASWTRAIVLGLTASLVFVIRMNDVVILLALPFLGVASMAAMRQRLALIGGHLGQMVAATAAAAVLVLLQMTTWYLSTGHWLIAPYSSAEHFYWTSPQLLKTLIWFKPHGLLPYAPVLGFSFLGVLYAWVRRRDIAIPVTIAFIPLWYVISAWWDWSFTVSFGDRAFIDILPLLALPFALLCASIPTGWWRRLFGVLVAGGVYATGALMIFYWQYRLSGDGTRIGQWFQFLIHPQWLGLRPL